MNFVIFNNANEVMLNEQYQHRRRVYRPRINFNFLEYPIGGTERFRLTNQQIEMLYAAIGPYIRHRTNKNAALSPKEQIMLSLRYLATGDIMRTIGDAHGPHKSTVSRTLRRFVCAVNTHVYPNMVKWPNSPNEIGGIAQSFYDVAGIPSVFGCIDGSHCKIIAPSQQENEPQFVNRHGTHSINALFVCGPTLRFYYVSSQWPGSVGDARVFRLTELYRQLERGWNPLGNGVLLGDSGYANCDYLITPLLNPVRRDELAFNKAHKQTRRFVECALGVLKQRFRCLDTVMPFKAPYAAEIIKCCAALHNFFRPEAIPVEDLEYARNAAHLDPNLEDEASDDNGLGVRRAELIRLF